MVLPPPTATATSAFVLAMTPTRRSISFADGMPPNASRVTGSPAAFRDVVTSCPTKPHTTSSATISGVLPMGARYSPSREMAPGPWAYRPGLMTERMGLVAFMGTSWTSLSMVVPMADVVS